MALCVFQRQCWFDLIKGPEWTNPLICSVVNKIAVVVESKLLLTACPSYHIVCAKYIFALAMANGDCAREWFDLIPVNHVII
jgi:hypothetical protein